MRPEDEVSAIRVDIGGCSAKGFQQGTILEPLGDSTRDCLANPTSRPSQAHILDAYWFTEQGDTKRSAPINDVDSMQERARVRRYGDPRSTFIDRERLCLSLSVMWMTASTDPNDQLTTVEPVARRCKLSVYNRIRSIRMGGNVSKIRTERPVGETSTTKPPNVR